MTDSNKDAAVSFLKLAVSGKVREAYSKFVGAGFRHHNPFFEGSAETLLAGMEENVRLNPSKVLEVKRAIAEGELVAVHSLYGRSLVTSARPLSTSSGLRRAVS
jgi:predicted SnoaL-like aldol condensation-catalyzing enzyme